MRTIEFDALGYLSVTDVTVQKVEGVDLSNTCQRIISPDQLAAHLVMFQDDMTPDQLAQAQAIIAAQGGA